MVLEYHPSAQEETGTIGLLIVVAGKQASDIEARAQYDCELKGMLGSMACGYILDRWHHYKFVGAKAIIADCESKSPVSRLI